MKSALTRHIESFFPDQFKSVRERLARYRLFWGIVALLATLTTHQAAGQLRYPIQRVSGLSHNTVTWITQDRRGFIWTGTIDGLNRFDGYSCRVFKHDPTDPKSISSSFIQYLYIDHLGVLWVTTRDGGLNRYDESTETFTAYKHDPSNPSSIGDNKTGNLVEDASGHLLIATEHGLDVFDQTSGLFSHFSHNPADSASLSNNEITGILPNTDGTVWVSTDHGLNKLDLQTGHATRYVADGTNPRLPHNHTLTNLVRAPSGKIWIGTRQGGIEYMDERTGLFTDLKPDTTDSRLPSNQYVNPMMADESGNIWFGTHAGINLFEAATGLIQRLPSGTGAPPELARAYVSAIAEDRAGDFWVGTWGDGMYHISRRLQKFSTISTMTSPGTLPSDFILSFAESRNGVTWVGTSTGISRIDPASNPHSTMLQPNISGWCIEFGTDSSVWVGTEKNGIHVYRPDGSFKYEIASSESKDLTANGLPDQTVRVLFADKQGRMWAGTQHHGVSCYDQTTHRWTRFPFNTMAGDGTSDELVWAANQDHSSNLWFGTYLGGLDKLDARTGKFTYFRHKPADSTSLGADDIRCICVTTGGSIWVGTYGGGIALFDSANGKWKSLTSRNGLANDFVYGILEDFRGDLWISTNRGLSRYSPATGTFRNYSSRDGLQSDEFNTGAFYKTSPGEFLFGGVSGLNRFFPADIRDNETPAPVVLTSFKVFGVEHAFQQPAALLRSISLRYDENYFSIEFAALDFVDASRNQYAYMLEGFDKTWNFSGSRRYASYTNIDPGPYRLRIKAANSDGFWNENAMSIPLVIVPPFWMTTWFRILSGLLLAAGFAGAVRYFSTRKLRAHVLELEKQQALQMERERISRDLHDNVGSQLSSIIAGLEMAGKAAQKSDSPKRDDLLTALKDDARLTMSQLRETIWAMSSSALTAAELLENIGGYARRQLQHRAGPNLHTVLSCEPGVTLSPMQVLHLFRIAQEALNNALKYAAAENIRIELKRAGESLVLLVADDGVATAAPSPEEFSGRGLLNMERRAKELGGICTVRRENGMSLEVTIPLDVKYPK